MFKPGVSPEETQTACGNMVLLFIFFTQWLRFVQPLREKESLIPPCRRQNPLSDR
jgi:hypothetical protein